MSSLTPEQKQIGADNYYEALGISRRDFLKGVALAGVTSGAGLGAMYFGYGERVADPVRIGVIGTGDEGSVLIGSLNPNYVDVKAICDIRPVQHSSCISRRLVDGKHRVGATRFDDRSTIGRRTTRPAAMCRCIRTTRTCSRILTSRR